jgi:hypothetical protein
VKDRLESVVVCLVLAAAGDVLVAPVLGRYGAPILANLAVGVAAAAGIGAFLATAYDTLRAARKTTKGT